MGVLTLYIPPLVPPLPHLPHSMVLTYRARVNLLKMPWKKENTKCYLSKIFLVGGAQGISAFEKEIGLSSPPSVPPPAHVRFRVRRQRASFIGILRLYFKISSFLFVSSWILFVTREAGFFYLDSWRLISFGETPSPKIVKDWTN